MGQWDSGAGYRLSAIGCPLGGISERGERSDCQTADIRHTVFPNARGGEAPSAPGFCLGKASLSGLVQRVVIKSTPWRQSGRFRRYNIRKH